MMFPRLSLCLLLPAALAAPLPAAAQKYPEKAVRMIVAFPTGASQILGLLTAEKLREATGQAFVPDFKPGAGGNLASELTAKAPPDGYTLLLTSGTIAISPSLYSKLGWTINDFTPIALIATVPNVMVVHPNVPAKNIQELIKLAKAQPGKLNFGSGGVGSGGQLGSEMFKALAKVNMVHVPYKGASIAMTAMLGGEVDMVVSTVPATIPLINSGKLRGLAILGPKRVPAIQKIPTTAESGMPELTVITWYGLFAPAGVKPDVVERVNSEVNKFLKQPEVVKQLNNQGLDPASGTPADFAKFVREDTVRWARVIKAANIRID
jgi:tripartite-type tricarboxylate transporter receptor subunit TctC